MKHIALLSFSLLSFAPALSAQGPAPAPTPEPPTALAAPAELAPPADTLTDEVQPRPKKKARVESRAGVKRIDIAESNENADVLIDSDSAPRFERRIAVVPRGPGEIRIGRKGPPGGTDVYIAGPKGGAIKVGPPGEGDRNEHLEQAIHHLHAAGMHDVADRIEAKLRAETKDHGQETQLREEVVRLKKEQLKLQKKLRKLQKPAPDTDSDEKKKTSDESEELKKPAEKTAPGN